jgi:hypothetical protein
LQSCGRKRSFIGRTSRLEEEEEEEEEEKIIVVIGLYYLPLFAGIAQCIALGYVLDDRRFESR